MVPGPARARRRLRSSAAILIVAVGCAGAPTPRAARTSVATTSTTTAAATTTVPVPADIQALVTATTLNERGRRAFLAAAPAIEDAATFARNCGIDSQPDAPDAIRVHTQGCYVNGRIHLLANDRTEAKELLAVVAAHELLHAVYASLGAAERSRIDTALEVARVGNARLEERLRSYGASPTLDNEIHSILGSEFDGLSPVLDAHYAQYFDDRSRVVAARQHTLGSREDEMKRLKADIDDLDGRITALKATQDTLRANGDIRAFNANVPVVNGLISRYNAQIETLNALIDQYNALLGA